MNAARSRTFWSRFPAAFLALGFALYGGGLAIAVTTGTAIPGPDSTPEEELRHARWDRITGPMVLSGEALFVVGVALFGGRAAAKLLPRSAPPSSTP